VCRKPNTILLEDSSKMIGYKLASSNSCNVIVTLRIPNDSKTNINRSDIVDKKYAKYRTNKATIIDIEDMDGNKYNNAVSSVYTKKKIQYITHETITEENYNEDVNIVCGEGIHFFIDKEASIYYGTTPPLFNGEFKKWWDNGQLLKKATYVNGNLHGEYKEWWSNGQLTFYAPYINGKLHGEHKRWYPNGQLHLQITYVNGLIHGEYKEWYENGQPHTQAILLDGTSWKGYKRWNPNGELDYVDGILLEEN